MANIYTVILRKDNAPETSKTFFLREAAADYMENAVNLGGCYAGILQKNGETIGFIWANDNAARYSSFEVHVNRGAGFAHYSYDTEHPARQIYNAACRNPEVLEASLWEASWDGDPAHAAIKLCLRRTA